MRLTSTVCFQVPSYVISVTLLQDSLHVQKKPNFVSPGDKDFVLRAPGGCCRVLLRCALLQGPHLLVLQHVPGHGPPVL